MKGQPKERVDSWPMSLGPDWGVIAFCLIAPISEVRGIKILLLRREGHLGMGGGNGNWSPPFCFQQFLMAAEAPSLLAAEGKKLEGGVVTGCEFYC